jgi:protein-L-isoaspartate(D-aspartate) O-methyltransferase
MKEMVNRLISLGYLHDERLIEALGHIDRKHFIEIDLQKMAYHDRALASLSRGGQVISTSTQPSLLISMIESLDIAEDSAVLEIGTGTGFCACLISRMAGSGRIISFEIDSAIAERARRNTSLYGIENARILVGDGRYGYPDEAPYDAIISMVAFEGMNKELFLQMRPHSRAVMPVFRGIQDTPVFLFEKVGDDSFEATELTGAIFMTAQDVKPNPIYGNRSFKATFGSEEPYDLRIIR